MVSVRVSAYQHSSTIAKCIESILSQKTDFPFEIIIGEDFSTDGTREIVQEYAKKHPKQIRVITSNNNVGSKKNGYRCIKAIRGKYTAICEGDDYWIDEYKLQKQIEFLESNPDYSLSYSKAITYKADNKKFGKEIGKKIQSIEHLLRGNKIPAVTSVYRTENYECFLEFLKANNRTNLTMDYSRCLYLYTKGKFHFLNEVTSVYRISEGSMSNQLHMNNQEAYINQVYEIKQFYSKLFNMEHLDFVGEEHKYKLLLRIAARKFPEYKVKYFRSINKRSLLDYFYLMMPAQLLNNL